MFKGTTYEGKFFIMHDGLSQWWEKEAQEYMEMLGFKDRQIKCLPPANEGNRGVVRELSVVGARRMSGRERRGSARG